MRKEYALCSNLQSKEICSVVGNDKSLRGAMWCSKVW